MNLKDARIVVLTAFSLAFLACSGDEKPREPEIVGFAGQSGGSQTRPAPEFLRPESAVGTYGVPIGGPAGVTGLESVAAGLTLRRTELAEVPADEAFVVAMLQPRPPGPPSAQLPSRDQTA